MQGCCPTLKISISSSKLWKNHFPIVTCQAFQPTLKAPCTCSLFKIDLFEIIALMCNYCTVQLNLHETNLLFWYLSHHLTWHCLLISGFSPILVFVLIFISVQNNFMIATNKNWEKREKNHKSTSNVMSNDGSSIKIIDRSHGD